MEDDTKWLVYWILFGAGTVLEGIAFTFLGRDECRDGGGLTLYVCAAAGVFCTLLAYCRWLERASCCSFFSRPLP